MPALLVARTWKVCFPSLTLYAFGERQDAHLPLSSLQLKCEPFFEDVNLKTALAVQKSIDYMFGDFANMHDDDDEIRRFLDAMENGEFTDASK